MISDKQKKILAFQYSRYDALICDGAVRSGKASIMTWAFIEWAMREFNGQRYRHLRQRASTQNQIAGKEELESDGT